MICSNFKVKTYEIQKILSRENMVFSINMAHRQIDITNHVIKWRNICPCHFPHCCIHQKLSKRCLLMRKWMVTKLFSMSVPDIALSYVDMSSTPSHDCRILYLRISSKMTVIPCFVVMPFEIFISFVNWKDTFFHDIIV